MAEENEKRYITLHVCDTGIRVNILRSDEPLYRNAAKIITDTVNLYSEAYRTTKSEKEILYMAMIDIALKLQIEKTRNDTAPYEDILSKITTEVEQALGVGSAQPDAHKK